MAEEYGELSNGDNGKRIGIRCEKADGHGGTVALDRWANQPKIGIRKPKTVSSNAVKQNSETEFEQNESELTTGNENYKSPGSAGGMT